MSDGDFDPELLNDLAHEFAERVRRGERPSVSQYALAHPRLAAEINDLFPTMMLMEGLAAGGRLDSAEAPPTPAALPPQLGEYRIVREIGRGGMGVVYEAVQESLGRHVALKVLPPRDAANENLLERFRREAQAAARLHHTNIVPVFGVGEDQGVHFYAMQFIHGRTLDRVLAELQAHRRSRVESPDAELQLDSTTASLLGTKDGEYYRRIARVGAQAAEALAYAHLHGVLHRDIKPANLLFDIQGSIWVSDFGLARIEGVGELTMAEDVVGTARYIPPERFHGRSDARGDVYSLGITLYELLTLQPAFKASTRAELIRCILHQAPRPPRELDRNIPRDLETIVLKATAAEPEQRYQSAADLAADLKQFLADQPIRARRTSSVERTLKWCRRHRVVTALSALSLVLLVAVTAVSLTASVILRNQLVKTRAAERESRRRLYESLVVQAQANRKSGESGQRFTTLRALRKARALADELQLPPSEFARLRQEAIAALCLPDYEVAKLLPAWPAGTVTLDFDPQFLRYVRGDVEGRITIHRVADDSLLDSFPSPEADFELSTTQGAVFSHDGRFLQQVGAVRGAPWGYLRLWDVSATGPRMLFQTPKRAVGSCNFSPDSRRIALVMADDKPANPPAVASYHVHVLAADSGKDCVEPLPAERTSRTAFHPLGSLFAISDSAIVRIMDLSSGVERSRWALGGAQLLSWSPDGRQLAAVRSGDTQIRRWDVVSRRELPPLEMPPGRSSESIWFSHSGRLIAAVASDQSYHLWDAHTSNLLFSDMSALARMRFSRDDRMLVGETASSGRVRLLNIAGGEELQRFALGTPLKFGSPRAVLRGDERLMAVGSRGGTVLIDIQRGEHLGTIPGVRTPVLFEPDGSLLTQALPPEGVVRWPVVSLPPDSADSTRLQLGPKQPLAFTDNSGIETLRNDHEVWSASRDGRMVSGPRTATGPLLFMATTPGPDPPREFRCRDLGAQYRAYATSVSPDGRWVASGSDDWLAKPTDPVSVTVWETASGRRVWDLPRAGVPRFSSDGRWLAVLSGSLPSGVGLWRVGSWTSGPKMPTVEAPGGVTEVVFDAKSQLMAIQGHSMRLLVPETGEEVARLTVPEKTSLAPQFFTPDGSRLVATGTQSGHLYIWDLGAIRRQLAPMGLDWNSPLCPESPSRAAPLPLGLEVRE